MRLVVDASSVVAALVVLGSDGDWARGILEDGDLSAPHLLPVEVAHALRREAGSGRIAQEVASLAFADLQRLPVNLLDFEPFGERIWELRHTLTPYDAWYVAIAESLDAPLATLDVRLTGSPGPRCRFVTPTSPPGLL